MYVVCKSNPSYRVSVCRVENDREAFNSTMLEGKLMPLRIQQLRNYMTALSKVLIDGWAWMCRRFGKMWMPHYMSFRCPMILWSHHRFTPKQTQVDVPEPFSTPHEGVPGPHSSNKNTDRQANSEWGPVIMLCRITLYLPRLATATVRSTMRGFRSSSPGITWTSSRPIYTLLWHKSLGM